MLRIIETYFILFVIYSFFGWFMESFGGILKIKKFLNRGFLIGPYCPVYGIGVISLTILLKKYQDDIVSLFFLSMWVCATLEYITSYMMEKIFNARWWDYTKRMFNINGRVCLTATVMFGVFGCVFIKFTNPFFLKYIDVLSDGLLSVITIIVFCIMFIDICISTSIIMNFRKETNEIKDDTDEIVAKVKEATIEISNKIQADSKLLIKNIRLNTLKLKHNIKYYRKNAIPRWSNDEIKEIFAIRREKFENRIKANKMLIQLKLDKARNDQLLKIEERFKNKSKLHERLLKAFPDREIKKK